MKIYLSIVCLIFLAFAYLQLNDPDPVLWVFIYLSVSVQALMTMFGVQIRHYTLVTIIFIGLYALTLIPALFEWTNSEQPEAVMGVMKPSAPWIEESREFLGLILALIALFLTYVLSRKRNSVEGPSN